MQPALTFLCPSCKKVSVADRDADGFPVCPHCDMDQTQTQGSDLYSPTVKRIMHNWEAGKFEPKD